MFATEQNLVKSFKHIYKNFLKEIINIENSNTFLIDEYDSQYGIADLIMGTCNELIQTQNNRNSINFNWVLPLIELPIKQSFTISDFSEQFSISNSYALKCVKSYIEANFVEKIDRKTYQKISKYEVITNDIISIEAKLRDWKKALKQAYRYKSFSHMSFVLLDVSFSKKAIESLSLFKEYNIGLITMDESKFKIHFIPERKGHDNSFYYLRANEFIYNHFKSLVEVYL